jgi:hypothetical protein
MTRQSKILIGAMVAIAAVAAYWFLLLSPKREEATRLQGDIDKAQIAVDAARAQATALRQAKASYDRNYSSVARLGKAVPADDDVRSLVVQIDEAADRSGVDFRTIEVGTGTGGGGGTPTTPPANGTAASAASAATLPPGASVGPAGFPTMPFTFQFDGSFFSLSEFFARLERFVTVANQRINVTGRLLTVDAFSLKPSQKGWPLVRASMGATAFLVPADQGVTAGATSSGPAADTGSGTPAEPGKSVTSPPTVTATSPGVIR